MGPLILACANELCLKMTCDNPLLKPRGTSLFLHKNAHVHKGLKRHNLLKVVKDVE